MDGSAGRPAPCAFSLIVEWENADRIGSGPALRMVAEIGRQIAALPPDLRLGADVVFVHDGAPDSAAAIEATIRAAPDFQAPWRSIGSADPSYGGQKRAGAEQARGRILVFLDSDVIPQAEWLKGLIEPFAGQQAEIVCGATFVEPRDFYSSTMALGWLFPLRRPETGLVESKWLQANNFAVRREIFLALPAPPAEGYRDGTVRIVEMLLERGHRILLNRSAAVAHPPPDGARHFVLRALWSGYDNALRYRRRLARWRGAAVMLSDLLQAWVRVRQNYRRVGFGSGRAVAAGGLLSIYYVLRIGGYAAGLAAPGVLERCLRWADR